MQTALAMTKSEVSALSDKELLNNVINGDLDYFDVIVDRYKNRLVNFVYRFVNERREN